MRHDDIYSKYEFLEKQMHQTHKEFDAFRKEHSKELEEHRAHLWNEQKAKNKVKRQREIEVHEKVIKYLEPGMWVKVKTRAGSIFQKVVEIDKHYLSVKCARPVNMNHVKFDMKTGKYSVPELTMSGVSRTDDYFSRSFISVLVPDGNGFYDEKSFKKDLFK